MFAVKGLGQVALFQTIDNLNPVDDFTVEQDVQARSFDNQIIKIFQKILDADFGNKFRLAVFLRIVRVESPLVLDKMQLRAPIKSAITSVPTSVR